MEKLLKSLNSLQAERNYVEREAQRFKEELDRARVEEEKLEGAIALDMRAFSVVQRLFELLNKKGLNVLDYLINQALAQLFENREYNVKHMVETERGANTLNFILTEAKPSGEKVESNVRHEVGGGIRAVVGLVSLIYYLMKTKSERFIIFDEALSQFDDSVVESLFSLLRAFGKKGKFSFILITHDTRFVPYFDVEYRLNNRGGIEKVK